MKYKKITPILLILALSLGCGAPLLPADPSAPPSQQGDGFAVGSLEDVGLDRTEIEELLGKVRSGQFGEVHSLLIYKEGLLVLEEYFPGHDYMWDGPKFQGALVEWDRDKEHNVHSVGKSITSACIGIAIEQGFIANEDQPIFDFLPEHQVYKRGGKDQITIAHLLAMTSGMAWDEWNTSYGSLRNDVISIWFACEDPIACILKKPLLSQPGTEFNYSGGNTILLGEIIKNATGMDIESFAALYLFQPLGVESPAWRWIGDSGVVFAAADQSLTPREMLKFGVVYLNGGLWNGQRVLSADWVEKSAVPYPGPDHTWFNHFLRPIPPGDGGWGLRGYSYSWWTHVFSHQGRKYPAYWAYGWGGQKIVIFPDQDAVIVFTGGNYSSADTTAAILTRHLVPALD